MREQIEGERELVYAREGEAARDLTPLTASQPADAPPPFHPVK